MSARRITHPAVLVAIVPFAWLVSRFLWTCDDAFISFRYVQHLVRGDGLTFNPGEAPPVEGFTNLLWILLMAPFEAIGIALPVAANLVSAACAVALLALLNFFLRARRVSTLSSGAAALVFATLPPVVVWSTGGLETMPFALAIFAVYAALAMDEGKPHVICASLFALVAMLLRADGALWCGFAFLAALASCSREERGGMWKAVLTSGVLLTFGVIAHFVWRHQYFGEWLPNTAKIKTGFTLVRAERGLKYIASLALASPALALIPLMAILAWRRVQRETRFTHGALLFVALSAAYTVYVGGDFMAMGRFLVPAMPFLVLAFAGSGEAFGGRMAPVLAGSVMVALGLLGCLDRLPVTDAMRQAVHFRWNGTQARSEVEQWAFMRREAIDSSELGRALALHTERGEALVRGNIGAVGYYCDLVLLDINGLVIPEVAESSEPIERASPGHDRRVEANFFNDRKPQYQYAVIQSSNLPARLGFGDRWKRMLNMGKFTLERIPLSVTDGFEAGAELRLLRDLRWDETDSE